MTRSMADDHLFRNKYDRFSVTCGDCNRTYGDASSVTGAKYEQLVHNRKFHPDKENE